jgi:anti-anti-sigma factor
MNITTTPLGGGVTVLAVDGRLNVVTAPAMKREVQNVLRQGDVKLAIDLSAVEFIDSSGLGALIGGLKAARTAGGDLRIAGATEQVVSVLRLTNLDKVLRLYESAQSAYGD